MRRLRSARCFTGERGWPSTRLGPQALWPCRLSRLPSGWGVATPPFLPLLPLPFFPGRGGGQPPWGGRPLYGSPFFAPTPSPPSGTFTLPSMVDVLKRPPFPLLAFRFFPGRWGSPNPGGREPPFLPPVLLWYVLCVSSLAPCSRSCPSPFSPPTLSQLRTLMLSGSPPPLLSATRCCP